MDNSKVYDGKGRKSVLFSYCTGRMQKFKLHKKTCFCEEYCCRQCSSSVQIKFASHDLNFTGKEIQVIYALYNDSF